MLLEWSAECGTDDPVLVVPWSSSAEDAVAARFVDLRENPYDLDQIPEAEQHPALLQALRALNAARSSVFTAKCDAWTMDEDERAAVALQLDLTGAEATSGFASYLDLVWRDRSLFVSFPQQEQRLQRLARLLEPVSDGLTMIDCILRPAMVDLSGAGTRFQEGFSVSLYVKAVGMDAAHAYANWAIALNAVVTVLRGKDFS